MLEYLPVPTQNLIPNLEDGHFHVSGLGILAAFVAAVAPAAALGAITGSVLAEVTPKQMFYAKAGALAGVGVVAAVLAISTMRRD